MLTENARIVLEKRYLTKDEKGKPTETIDGMFHRVAHAIAGVDKNYSGDAEETEKEFYDMMTKLEFLPNSPTLMNAGLEDGQLSACFVLPVEDSMESIFDAIKNTALIHKSGGGTGFNFSQIRAEGSPVMSTGGVASGPISFMKVFDSATNAVVQGGKRRGASMGILEVTHPDILKFIDCKKDNDEINNFNISIGITEGFMSAVDLGDDYDLIDPRTKMTVGKLNAREVFNKIVDAAWRNGEPGIIFLDRLDKDNVVPKQGKLNCTNPCGEQSLLPYESCNLGSINLTKMVKLNDDGKYVIDKAKLGKTVYKAVHFLDNVIDANHFPLRKIENMTKKTRKIGLGIMGWADVLLLMGIPYNSEKAISLAEETIKLIHTVGVKASRELAKKRGEFPLYKESTFEEPQRNGTITTLAPTGCQNPHTIVGTDRGLLHLSELVDENGEKWQEKQDTNAYQAHGTNKITKGYVNGIAKTKKITLSNNLILEATHNHQYVIIRDGKKMWCRTDELMIGDIVPSKVGYYNETNEYEFIPIEQKNYNNIQKMASLPTKMTPKLAFFLGAYYANGSCHYKSDSGRFHSIRISMNSEKQEDIEIVINHIRDLFGLEPSVYVTKRRESVTSIDIVCTNLCRWLEANELKKQKALEVQIPKAIRMSSKESIEAFLEGYWMCDGSSGVSVKYIDTASKQMAQDILVLMRAIGIDATIRIDEKRSGAKSQNPMYRVRIVKYRSCGGESVFRYVKRGKKEKLQMVREIMGGDDFVYDTVEKIEESECMTLDIEVEKEHYYLANGIISHNTISIIGGCSSGIEPIFAYVYIRNVMDGTQMLEVNPILKEEFIKRGIYSDELMKRIAKEGTLKNIEGIPDDIKRVFVSAHDISPEYHVRMQAAFQKYTDNAVSKTVNFPNSATREDVARVYQLAYRTGCKGTTIYRDGSRDEQVLNVGGVKSSSAEEENQKPRERPEVIFGVTEKIKTGCGNLFVTVNHDEHGICEVLTNTSKSGGCPSQSEATARLASLVLRSGIEIDELCEQLKGIRCPSTIRQPGMKCTSCPDAIARSIQRVKAQMNSAKEDCETLPDEEPKVDVCPECGSPLEHDSGCVICRNCSYSKCG